MKKQQLAILFFFIVSNSFSQSIEQLRTDAKKMYDAAYTMDFEAIADFTYPKLFDFVTKEAFIELMDNTFQNEILKVRLVYPSVTFNYSEIKTIEDRKFCVIRYKNAMRLTYEEKMEPEKIGETIKVMEASKKYTSVTFEKNRNSLFIIGDVIAVAIADASTKNKWKFVNYDDGKTFSTLFSENIKTALGL